MAVFLGVDTGGTYTDAVLVEGVNVLAKAKALTTRDDLSRGIGAAVDRVLGDSGVAPEIVALVSLSTTLATNALVEGQGGRVALISVGFRAADMRRQGLDVALKGDPLILVPGGHDHSGMAAAELDIRALESGLAAHGGEVGAFAVVAQFATRNPAHEIAVREVIRARLGKPVSCSFELSSQLGGPKRGLTALLNARLISMIAHLIDSAEALMAARGIGAPLMVVRGDGALVAADMARARPIETILSGPAASLVGARWLTGAMTALVADIGGTTTDVALLRDGRPSIDPLGAKVGAHRTMVEAVAMRTTGLGGDSEVQLGAADGGVVLGPRRRVPLSLFASQSPALAHKVLDAQLASGRRGEHDGLFAIPVLGAARNLSGLGARALALLERLGAQAAALEGLVPNRLDLAALQKLVSRGLVQVSGLTPSDASHILGTQSGWDAGAARKGAALFARRKTTSGGTFAAGPQEVAHAVVAALTVQTAEAVMTAGFAADGFDDPEHLARHTLVRAAQRGHRGVVRLDAGLALPLIGLGASAATYYPAVGQRLGCKVTLPEHADVANAIGAVVGRVEVHVEIALSAPHDGVIRVHTEQGTEDFAALEPALKRAEAVARDAVETLARDAGCDAPKVSLKRRVKTVNVEGAEKFVEAVVRADAVGRPRGADV